jgi:phospholipid/cholesterol/gamma-HCH transport system ATP-binding protein
MIRVDALHKQLAGQRVLDGVTLEVPRGQAVALVGPSGTGKSVLLKHIIGLMQPDSGDVVIDDVSVVRAGYKQLATLRRRIGYVFQDAALLDSLTVEENLRLALNDAACAHDPEHCARRILAALHAVNLAAPVLDKLPGELSGGMRKRVGVARALINQPDIILYDEPTTGLDPQNTAVINQTIAESRKRNATSLVITHDIDAIRTFADRVVMLEDGRIRFDGTPADFYSTQTTFTRLEDT